MVLGERRRRSVIAKLVELAIALSVLLLPTSALALTRASVVENTSALAARNAKTRVRGFELGPAKIASGFELSSARNASGKSARERGEGVRVHHRNRVWSPELGAFLSPDEFRFFTANGTLWSWPGQNPTAFEDTSGRDGGVGVIVWILGGEALGGGAVAGAAAAAPFAAVAAAGLAGKAAIDAYMDHLASEQSAAAVALAVAGAEAANMAARKGERGRTAKQQGTPNPTKKFRWDEKKQLWKYKDADGKWKWKPPGFKPQFVPIPWSEDELKCE